MSYLINNEQKINDIIFANRNKNYGAYAIRSSYGNTLIKSLTIMAFGFVSLMGSAYYYANHNNPENKYSEIILKQDSLTTTVFDMEKKMDQKKENNEVQPETKQKTSTETAASTHIVDSAEVTTTTTSVTFTNSGAATSSVVSDGGTEPGTGTNTAIVSNTNSTGGGGKEPYQNFGVDSNPEFDGGLEALYRFVGSKLKYPTTAYRENKEGTVYVKFVVDENGKVCNLNLLNTAGYGMDEEALRVVALIPNFKTPAKVKGKAVKVYYQLPIKYRMH